MEAWERANQAARAAGVALRPIATLEDADRLLRVMGATWGDHDGLPREMVVALADSGNVPYGAFDGQDLIGFVLGWAGVTDADGLHAHSHMLATLPDRRHAGVGYALKLAQRAQCLDQEIIGRPMDVRSARRAQRLVQPGQAGRDGGPVPARLLR